jgi:hypothetical protein
MALHCSICVHDRRKEIDRAIIDGTSLRKMAERFGITMSSANRHKPHVMAVIAKAHDAKEITHGDNLLEQLKNLTAEARDIAATAKKAKQYGAAMSGVREMVRIVELVAKLTGALDESARVNVAVIQQQQREN